MANKNNKKKRNNNTRNSNKSVSMKKDVIIKNNKEELKEEIKKEVKKVNKNTINNKEKDSNKKNNNKKVYDKKVKSYKESINEEVKDEVKELDNEDIIFNEEETIEDNYEDIMNEKEDKLFTNKYFLYILLIPIIVLIVLSFTYKEKEKVVDLNYVMSLDGENIVYEIEDNQYIETEEETDLVKIEVKDRGIMIAELYPDTAPETVENFKGLVKEGYYDGLTFHRVISDFMIQTGDPTGTGSGGSENTIEGEFEANGIENNLEHTRGVLSMARQVGDPDTEETMNSASSQFFIVQKDYPSLNGMYAAFGKVINGLDVLDGVATTQTDDNDKPVKDEILSSITFVTEYSPESEEVE